jgi:hypothetical protein
MAEGDLPQEFFQNKAGDIGKPTYQQIGSSRIDYIISGYPRYTPRIGKNCVRIIRPLDALEIKGYGLDLYFHRGRGAQRDNIVCARGMFGSICYTCGLQTSELYQINADAWTALTPEKKILMWILDLYLRQGEDNYATPLIWPCPKTLAEEILKQSNNPETGSYIDVSNPKFGVPVYFDRTGERRNTKYSGVQIGREPWPMPEGIVELTVPLGQMVNLLSQDEIQKIEAGGEVPEHMIPNQEPQVPGEPTPPATTTTPDTTQPATTEGPAQPATTEGPAQPATMAPPPPAPDAPDPVTGRVRRPGSTTAPAEGQATPPAEQPAQDAEAAAIAAALKEKIAKRQAERGK